MRWPIFFVILFVTAVLQITATRYLPLADGLVRPDFLALLALFFSLYAPRHHAPLAALIVGLVADLLSFGPPFGTFAFSFGLLGLLILWARRLLYPDHPISRIILAFCWSLLTQLFAFAIPWILGPHSFADFMSFSGLAVRIALYTAVFTPVYYLMVPGKRWFILPLAGQRF
ncbi:MAG: rod shape-determining protein MreD [Actinobacteria bacterium]|nr:rod shape-determining protein MreD [Actinomycetota bacterium]